MGKDFCHWKLGWLLNNFLRYLSDGGVMLSCAGIFIMVVYITVGVIFRYVLNAPIIFIDELSGYIFVFAVYMSLAYAVRIRAHISVSLFVSWLPERARAWVDMAQSLISLPIVGILLWQSIHFWLSTKHELSSYVLQTPLWIPRLFVWVGLAIFELALIGVVVNKFRTLRGTITTEEYAERSAFGTWEQKLKEGK